MTKPISSSSSDALPTSQTASQEITQTSSPIRDAVQEITKLNQLTTRFVALTVSPEPVRQTAALKQALLFSANALQYVGNAPAALKQKSDTAYRLRMTTLYKSALNHWGTARKLNATGSEEEIEALRKIAELLDEAIPLSAHYPQTSEDRKQLKQAQELHIQSYFSLAYALSIKVDTLENRLTDATRINLIFGNEPQDVLPLHKELIAHHQTAMDLTDTYLPLAERHQRQAELHLNLWSYQNKYANSLYDTTYAATNAPDNLLPTLRQIETTLKSQMEDSSLPGHAVEIALIDSGKQAPAAVDHFFRFNEALISTYTKSIELNESRIIHGKNLLQSKNSKAQNNATLNAHISETIPDIRKNIISDTIKSNFRRILLSFSKLNTKERSQLKLNDSEKLIEIWLKKYSNWFMVSIGGVNQIIHNGENYYLLSDTDRREFLHSMLLTFDDYREQSEDLLQLLSQSSFFYDDLQKLHSSIQQTCSKLTIELGFQATEIKDVKTRAVQQGVKPKSAPVRLMVASTIHDGKLVGEQKGNLLEVIGINQKKTYYRLSPEDQLWHRDEPDRFVELSDSSEDEEEISSKPIAAQIQKLENAYSKVDDEIRLLQAEAQRMTDSANYGYRNIRYDSQSINALVQIFQLGMDAENQIQNLSTKFEKKVAQQPKEVTESLAQLVEKNRQAANASRERVAKRKKDHLETIIKLPDCNGKLRYLINTEKNLSAKLTIKRKPLAGITETVDNKPVKREDFMDEIQVFPKTTNQMMRAHIHYRIKTAPYSESTAHHLIIQDEQGETSSRPPLSLETIKSLYQLCADNTPAP